MRAGKRGQQTCLPPTARTYLGSLPLLLTTRLRINDGEIVEDSWRTFLVSAAGDRDLPLYPPDHPLLPPSVSLEQQTPSPVTRIDWGVHLGRPQPTAITGDPYKNALSRLAKTTLSILNDNVAGLEEMEEAGADEFEHRGEHPNVPRGGQHKPARNYQSDPQTARKWFPWQDKLTCTLDMLMHLPRPVFSERQLDLFLFVLSVMDVPNVPSTGSMKFLNGSLQKLCGIRTLAHTGVLGNRYFVNDLGIILVQEMANPYVRPYVHFYPEDSGSHLQEARQGR